MTKPSDLFSNYLPKKNRSLMETHLRQCTARYLTKFFLSLQWNNKGRRRRCLRRQVIRIGYKSCGIQRKKA
jgi:hypothetical protein